MRPGCRIQRMVHTSHILHPEHWMGALHHDLAFQVSPFLYYASYTFCLPNNSIKLAALLYQCGCGVKKSCSLCKEKRVSSLLTCTPLSKGQTNILPVRTQMQGNPVWWMLYFNFKTNNEICTERGNITFQFITLQQSSYDTTCDQGLTISTLCHIMLSMRGNTYVITGTFVSIKRSYLYCAVSC
jgi:hypothetical protein